MDRGSWSMWNRMKKAPLLCGIVIGSMILTLAGMLGWDNIYAMQDKDPVQNPVLATVFTGINDGVYPWQLWNEEAREAAAMQKQKLAMMKEQADGEGDGAPEENGAAVADPKDPEETSSAADTDGASAQPSEEGASADGGVSASEEDASFASSASGADTEGSGADDAEKSVSENDLSPEFPKGRLEPLRESTYDEYINHISADIYGDMGVQRAASYEFTQVDESYFDDALFIGDSRTVGLHDYTDLSEHADFLCETSLTIYKVMEERFKGMGTVEEVLKAKEYGKIYLMVGINELGRGTTEDYMEKYTEVVDTLRALAPQAKIIIQANMRVSGTKSSSDAIFNNGNINARNNAVATLADNETFYYIDMNEAVCDENGDLTAEYTHDQIHLLGKYNELWKQFLLAHGV